jgi:hypothetical protein
LDCDSAPANGCEFVGTACCTAANQDLDRYTDCEEDNNGIFSASKYVFNGVRVTLATGGSPNGLGGDACNEVDTWTEIQSRLSNAREVHNIHSGWDFPSGSGYTPSSSRFGFASPI